MEGGRTAEVEAYEDGVWGEHQASLQAGASFLFLPCEESADVRRADPNGLGVQLSLVV